MKQFQVKEFTVIVDDIDNILFAHKWYPMRGKKGTYIAREDYSTGKRRTLLLHRVILEKVLGRELVKGELVDHENLNPLDNRRQNLRLATHSQNHGNQTTNANNRTGFKGIAPHGSGYRARITANKKSVNIGTFKTPEEAHAAYLAKAKELFGEFARGE